MTILAKLQAVREQAAVAATDASSLTDHERAAMALAEEYRSHGEDLQARGQLLREVTVMRAWQRDLVRAIDAVIADESGGADGDEKPMRVVPSSRAAGKSPAGGAGE